MRPDEVCRLCASRPDANAAILWATDAAQRPTAWLISLCTIQAGQQLLLYQGASSADASGL